jgi:hypothetical protein
MDRASQLPAFFVLGATKCGTTSIHHYLRQHPELYLPYVKELGFFRTPKEHFRTGLEDYLRYFQGVDAKKTGEATPGYFRHTEVVPDRMTELYDSGERPQFILVFRDPTERAFSHYLHHVGAGNEDRSFQEALQYEREYPKQSWENWRSYYRDGIYADPLETWLDHFPREQFLFLLTDDLAECRQDTMERTFDFLGVDPTVPIEDNGRRNRAGVLRSETVKSLLFDPPSWLHSLARTFVPKPRWRRRLRWLVRRLNSKPYEQRPTMDTSIEKELRQRYRPHIRRLESMIGRDLSAWYTLKAEESTAQ